MYYILGDFPNSDLRIFVLVRKLQKMCAILVSFYRLLVLEHVNDRDFEITLDYLYSRHIIAIIVVDK